MLLGVFDYAKYFPKSARLAEIKAAENQINAVSSKAPVFLSTVKYSQTTLLFIQDSKKLEITHRLSRSTILYAYV